MALINHITCRVYGEAFGSPPFQNEAGTQSAIDRFKQYPVAPLASVNLNNATIWPLVTGFWTGAFYVYSIIEQVATGTNHNTVKLATDMSTTNIIANGT